MGEMTTYIEDLTAGCSMINIFRPLRWHVPRLLGLCGIPRSLDSWPRRKLPFGVVDIKGLVESHVTLGRPLDSIRLSHRGLLLPACPRLVQGFLRYLRTTI